MKPDNRMLSRRANIFLMVIGMVLGQGLMFGAQSYLIYKEAYELTVSFSLYFAISVLGTLVVDSGGIVLLARKVVESRENTSNFSEIQSYFNALVWVRLIVWACISVFVVGYTFLFFDRHLLFFFPVILGLLAWCFNCAGVLDGFSLSGFSGLAAALPFVVSATSLPFLLHVDVENAFWLGGAAYGGGSILAYILQRIFLQKTGVRLYALRKVELSLLHRVFKDSCFFQLSFLPGQLLFRGQLMIANAILPTQMAALFVYGKQAGNAAQQIVGFARRSTFPELIRASRGVGFLTSMEIIRIQRSSLMMTAFFGFPMLACVSLTADKFPQWTNDIGFALFLVSPTVISSSYFSVFGQSLLAAGRFLPLSLLTFLITGLGLAGAYFLTAFIGVYAFIWAEVFAHSIGVFLIIWYIRKLNIGRIDTDPE